VSDALLGKDSFWWIVSLDVLLIRFDKSFLFAIHRICYSQGAGVGDFYNFIPRWSRSRGVWIFLFPEPELALADSGSVIKTLKFRTDYAATVRYSYNAITMPHFQTVRDYSGAWAKITVVRHALWIWRRYLKVPDRCRLSLYSRCFQFHTVIFSLLSHSILSACICWLCTNCDCETEFIGFLLDLPNLL